MLLLVIGSKKDPQSRKKNHDQCEEESNLIQNGKKKL